VVSRGVLFGEEWYCLDWTVAGGFVSFWQDVIPDFACFVFLHHDGEF
jgi:hypothetical protein